MMERPSLIPNQDAALAKAQEQAPFLVQYKLMERWVAQGYDEMGWLNVYAAPFRQLLEEDPTRMAKIVLDNFPEGKLRQLEQELNSRLKH